VDGVITHVAWMLPSEYLGAFIFTKAVWFAYKYKDDSANYFPVVGQIGQSSDVDVPERFEPSCHLQHFWNGGQPVMVASTRQVLKENKFWSDWGSDTDDMVLTHNLQDAEKKGRMLSH
jgi:hypothetical protein